MRTCEEHGIHCELQEGTLLGAVKLGKVLPWERDADITFLSSNFTALINLKDYFQRNGYTLTVTDPVQCCQNDLPSGGTIRLQGPRWPIELWGHHRLHPGSPAEANPRPTRILLGGGGGGGGGGGRAVNVPRNPGLHVRNRYGREVYRHAQHWMDLGLRDSWARYRSGWFTRCNQPGHHDCLDQYSADGNLQFGDPVP